MMIRNLLKKGQQEMVGFVLIVVIVIVGLIVFLVFSIGQNTVSENDIANNILSSVMKTTTSCALVYEPNYDDVRDLFRSCYEAESGGRQTCSNTGEDICGVLEETLESVLDEIALLEPTILAYQLDFVHSDSVGNSGIIRLIKGETACTGTVYGSEPHSIRISSDENLIVTLKICVARSNV